MTNHIETDYTSKAYIDPHSGYLTFYKPEHPLAKQNGTVILARHIASQMLGEWLTADQVVIYQDGNRLNCAPDNLRVITRAEMVYSWPSHQVKRIQLVCANPDCRQEFDVIPSDTNRALCSPECASEMQRRFRVNPREMAQMVWQMPTSQIAKIYGVSDVAIAKFCKKHGIKKPPRGYWAKLYAGRIDPATYGDE
jgi:hypothetical protein